MSATVAHAASATYVQITALAGRTLTVHRSAGLALEFLWEFGWLGQRGKQPEFTAAFPPHPPTFRHTGRIFPGNGARADAGESCLLHRPVEPVAVIGHPTEWFRNNFTEPRSSVIGR